mgnify:CR=1 FL=1
MNELKENIKKHIDLLCERYPAYQTGGKSAKGQCAGSAAGTNPQELIIRNERKVASLKRKLPFFFCLQ